MIAPSTTPSAPEHGAPAPRSVWAKLGRFSFRRRWTVLGAWLTVLVVAFALAGSLGTANDSAFDIPASESKNGFETLDTYFGGLGSGWSGSIVFRAEQGVADADVTATMTELFDRVAEIDDVTITSPYSPAGQLRGLTATAGDQAGLIAYAAIDLADTVNESQAAEIGKEINDLLPTGVDGLQIEVGGAALGTFEPPSSELIGLAFAVVILILAFGSVLAMGLPIGVALFGVGVGAGLIMLLSHVMTMPDIATTLGAMIGLGVGIDYALFIVTRFREGLKAGNSAENATVTAIDTAGRAVVFAGFTVVISLLGMFIIGLPFISGMATGAAVTVLVTMLASITLLPAFLGFAQHRVEVTRWRGLIAAGLVAVALLGVGLGIQPMLVGVPLAVVVVLASFAVAPLRRAVPARAERPVRETWAYRWSRFVQRHPWSILALSAGVLVALMIPVLGLRLGFSDESNFAESTTTRRAFDLTTEGFGPGANGPLVLTAELSGPADLDVLAGLAETLDATDGVGLGARTDPELADRTRRRDHPGDPHHRAAGRGDRATRPRTPRRRGARRGRGHRPGRRRVGRRGGQHRLQRLPHRRASRRSSSSVLSLSFLLLMMVFRSLLVPLKAVVMNMLSIGAAYGVVVMVFQFGWGASLFNIGGWTDRTVRADDDVRHRVRSVDGLRGVPALAGQGGVRPHRRRRQLGGRRPRAHREGDHRRGRDHGRGVRQLRAGGQPRHPDVRARPVGRGVPRCDVGAHAARARDHGAAR